MAEANVVINYEQVIQSIGEEFQDIWYALQEIDDEEIKKQISFIKAIEISDEQSFVRKRNIEKLLQDTLYIVIKFGSGAANFGSSVSPISLLCVGTANKVKPAQILLGTFSSTWTTKNLSQGLESLEGESLEIGDVLQVWNTPEVVSNFNEINADFRNLFKLTGNIVAGPSAVRMGTLTYYWGTGPNDYEEVNFMAFQDNYGASLDSQPFGNTKGFVKSEVNFSTYAFSISTYLLNNSHLSAAALSIRGFRNRNINSEDDSNPNPFAMFSEIDNQIVQNNSYFRVHKNQYLKIKLKFTNGFTNEPRNIEQENSEDDVVGSDFFMYYKIVSSQIGQELAGLPTLSITFTR